MPADQGTAAVVVISLDTLDLTALEPSAQATSLAVMARLLCSIDVPLRLLVRRRPCAAPGHPSRLPPGSIAAVLDAAMRAHGAATLAAAPAFRSVVRVVAGPDPDAAAGQRRAGLLMDTLQAAGLRPRLEQPSERTAEPAEHPRERARSISVGGDVCCALELERLPGAAVSLGWLHPMLNAPAAFDAVFQLTPLEPAAAHRAIDRRLRSLTADRLIEIERGRIGDPAIDVGLDAAGALRGRLARNEVRALRLSISVAAYGPTERQARHAADVIRSAAAGAGLRLRHAHLRHAATWRSTRVEGAEAPGGKLVDSAAAATCLPLTETVCDDHAGYRLGVGRRSGVPVAVDMFDTDQYSNANVAVFATSGHGKSFTIGLIVLEAITHGVGALIVDPEGEYEHLMHAGGGQYLRLGSAGTGALNVFDAAPTAVEAIPVAVDLIHVLCGGALDEVERARVDATLHAAVSAAAGRRTVLLGDCIAALDGAAPRAATVLRRVCGGSLGAVFNRPSDINLESDLCAISLRDLPHEFVPAATLLIAQWLWTRVRGQRRRRHIVLDEVGALCVHAPLRDLLVQLARRCRKYGASLVVATQNVEDLLRSEEGSVVATNCATVLLGGHRPAEAQRMERAFGLTDAQRRFVEHAPRGDFLLLAGRRRCEVRIDVPELHRSLLAPR